jgi:hypothetical protein
MSIEFQLSRFAVGQKSDVGSWYSTSKTVLLIGVNQGKPGVVAIAVDVVGLDREG